MTIEPDLKNVEPGMLKHVLKQMEQSPTEIQKKRVSFLVGFETFPYKKHSHTRIAKWLEATWLKFNIRKGDRGVTTLDGASNGKQILGLDMY